MTDIYDAAFAAAFTKDQGGGGTGNYNDLSNKPKINGNTLSGNKSSSALGITEPSLDTNGDVYFGAVRVARVMDSDSYAALRTKESIFYFTYPTPAQTREAEPVDNEPLKEAAELPGELVGEPEERGDD